MLSTTQHQLLQLQDQLQQHEDTVARRLLEQLNDTEHYPDEVLSPYQEFKAAGNTYYFTPGGFLYRKDPGTQEIGGYFCGYLTDEVWHYRTDNS